MNQYLTQDNTVDDFLRWRKEEATAEDDKMNRAFETKPTKKHFSFLQKHL